MGGATAGWGGSAAIPLLAALASAATLLLLAASHLRPHFQAHLGSPAAMAGSGTRRVLLPFRGSRGAASWDGAARLHAADASAHIDRSSMSAQSSCMAAVGDGGWRHVADAQPALPLPMEVASWNATDAFVFAKERFSFEWAWAPASVLECGIRRRAPAGVAAALGGKRLVFIGDSHMRYLHNSLARTLGGKELPKPVDGSPLQDLQQAIPAGAGGIRLELFRENYANGISHRLQGWGPGDWPDVLLLGSAEWHLFTQKNLTLYAAEMARLLATLKEQLPPSTYLVWLSPPPRDARKVKKLELPAEWIPLYDRVAQDLGFYRPHGPAFHLDLFHIGLGCLAWCTIADGIHVRDSVNAVLVQQLINAYLLHLASEESGILQPPDVA